MAWFLWGIVAVYDFIHFLVRKVYSHNWGAPMHLKVSHNWKSFFSSIHMHIDKTGSSFKKNICFDFKAKDIFKSMSA